MKLFLAIATILTFSLFIRPEISSELIISANEAINQQPNDYRFQMAKNRNLAEMSNNLPQTASSQLLPVKRDEPVPQDTSGAKQKEFARISSHEKE